MRVLVTGATGYIGSHTVVELLERGHDVIGVDDFSASVPSVQGTIEQISGQPMTLVQLDLRHRDGVDALIGSVQPDALIHFAGRKFVGESVSDPIQYYGRNVTASINLAEACQRHGVDQIIFSSSCTVYGEATILPVSEANPIMPVSPYGRSKAMTESVLSDLAAAWDDLSVLALRYFNPIGAHPAGILGEVPIGEPNNLLPYVMQVARGERPELSVFGDDYPTPDGTCIRDYVHVVDIAKAHAIALDYTTRYRGFEAMNLGTGVGRSVLEVIRAARDVTARPIPYRIVERRPGDAARVYAQAKRASYHLDWEADPDLHRMIADHWRFERSLSSERRLAS